MKEKKMKRLLALGMKITAAYLLIVVAVVVLLLWVGWIERRTLALNELGDFIAGSLGPLALIWLILSFVQQGEELGHSVEALERQAAQMAESVANDKASKERTIHLETTKDLPFFIAEGDLVADGEDTENLFYLVHFRNIEGYAEDVLHSVIHSNETAKSSARLLPEASQKIPNGELLQFRINLKKPIESESWEYTIRIMSISSLERVRIQDFLIKKGQPPINSTCKPPRIYAS